MRDWYSQNMKKNLTWRQLVQGVRHQKILVLLALVTVEEIITQLHVSDIISDTELSRLRRLLLAYQDKDLTHLQDIFHLEVTPQQLAGLENQPLRLNSLLRTLNRGKQARDNLKLSSLNWQFREMMSLLRVLRDARNAAAHDLSDRPEIGWNMTVYSSYLRIIEIAVVPEKLFKEVERQKSEIADAAVSFLKISGGSNEDQMEYEKSRIFDTSNSKSEEALKDEISLLRDAVVEMNDNIQRLGQFTAPTIFKERSYTKLEELQAEEHSEEENNKTSNDPTPFNFAITEGILRQRLEAMRRDLQEKFVGHEEWLGVASNVLQKSVISVIMKNKYGCIEDALNDEEIKWRFERHNQIMNAQLSTFAGKINNEIKKVIWNDET